MFEIQELVDEREGWKCFIKRFSSQRTDDRAPLKLGSDISGSYFCQKSQGSEKNFSCIINEQN